MMRRVTENSIQLRQGRMEDLPAIAAFTRKTFSWGDYIHAAWPRWVESSRGELMVAEVDGVLMGTCHIRYLENREAWLEGVRVHPAFRRHNLATTLLNAAHARAKRKRCRVIRLETASNNVRAQRLFEKLGYARVAEYARYRARSAKRAAAEIRRAVNSDAAACWELWQTALRGHRAHALTRAPFGWRWWIWTPTRLRAAIRAREVWLADDARAFMVTHCDQEFQILALAGSQRGMTQLAQGAKFLAHQHERTRLYWFTPHTARAERFAAQNRFALDDAGMLIYEYAL